MGHDHTYTLCNIEDNKHTYAHSIQLYDNNMFYIQIRTIFTSATVAYVQYFINNYNN